MNEITVWENLSPEEKKRELFLEAHTISQAQYDKSLGDLREKNRHARCRIREIKQCGNGVLEETSL